MRKQSLALPVVSAVVLALASAAPASAASNRIRQGVDDTARVSIAHNTSPRLKRATDLGEASATQQIPAITIRFNLTATQQAALDQLLIDQQNPASPQYHQWLSPAQFAAQFGMSSADLAQVQAWLVSKGFTVTEVAPSGLYIRATGTVGQAESAFGVQIHNFSYKGHTRIANLGDPTLPAAFADSVGSITGLDSFKLAPRVRRLSPDYTAPSGTTLGQHFIAPGDFYTIYSENALLSSGVNGAGITIAVMGQTDISLSAVTAFRNASGLTVNTPTVKLVGSDPGLSTSDIYEAQLDVEWAGAVAPSASILYVNSADVIDTSLSTAISSNLAPILTISYGDCEVNYGASALASFNTMFQEANAQGQTILGPAGDSGATDCDYASTVATEGLTVDFPGSSPYVTSVGGSLFGTTSSPQSATTSPESSTTFWSTGNATDGTYTASVLLPIVPQSVWNETAGYGSLAAGGGGASAYFTKPYWQTGTGVPADSSRDVPDLALNAAVLHDGTLICAPAVTTSSGTTLADCTNGFLNSPANPANATPDYIGGTSVATPSFAGILALLEQKLGGGTTGRIGNANPVLYALANSVTYHSSVYYDITSGNNESPCLNGSVNCPSGGGYIGFSAGTGYDQASGWGSVNAYNLVNDWTLVTPASAGTTPPDQSAVTLTTSPFSVTAGTSITLTAAAASNTEGVTATPTGSVQFYLDGTAAGSAVTLTSGSASYVLATTGLTSGSHTVAAVYGGNTTYSGSKGSALIDIVAATNDFTVSPNTVTMTAAPGASTSVVFTNTSVGGFTGNIYYVLSSAPGSAYIEYNVTTSSCNAGEGVGTTTIDGIPTCAVPVTPTAAGTTTFTLYAYGTASGASRLKPAAPKPVSKSSVTQPPAWYLAGSGVAVAGMLLLTLPRRRNRLGVALLAALLTAGVFTASGCSSGGTILSNGGGTTTVTSTGSSGYVNAAAGTYPLVVTAFSNTGQAHNIEVNFVVAP